MCRQRKMCTSINSIFITNFNIRIRSQAVAHGQGPPGPKFCPPLPGVDFNLEACPSGFLLPSMDIQNVISMWINAFPIAQLTQFQISRTINKGKQPLKIQKLNQCVSPPPYSFGKKNKTERTPFQTESLTQRVNRKNSKPCGWLLQEE